MPSQTTKFTPIDATLYYHLAIEALDNNCITDALSYIDMAISLSPEKSLFLFYKIKILYLSNLKDECLTLILTQFHYLYTNCPLNTFCELLDYYQTLATCTMEELSVILVSSKVPSILAFEYTSILNTELPNFHSKALEYKKSGNFQDCIDCCEIALKFQPDSVTLLHLQADCYNSLEDYQTTIRLYEQMLTRYPLTSEITYPLAMAYMQDNNFLKAISYFKHFLHTMPTHIDSLFCLGNCYIITKNYSLALPIFNKLIEIDPLNSSYYLKLGETYQLMNRHYLSKRYYKQANIIKGDFSSVDKSLFSFDSKLFKPSFILLLLLLLQFFLFKVGLISPFVYDINVIVQQSTISTNGFTDFKVSYKYFPTYAKEPTYTVTSNNPKIANIIDGLDSLNGLSSGKCTFEIKINGKPKTHFDISVTNPRLP